MVLKERGSKVFGRLRIGLEDGIFLSEIRLYTATIDVASVATNVVDAQTFTVTGLAADDIILAVIPDIDIGMGMGTVRVSAANTISIEFVNPTGGSVNPASGTWTFLVARPDA